MSPSQSLPSATRLTLRKSLGQNFLFDQRYQTRITQSLDIKADQSVLEVGPGIGHLTQHLVLKAQHVYCIEKDARFCAELKKTFKNNPVTIFQEDVLKFDFSKIPGPLIAVGNLPYYISSPIIEEFIKNRHIVEKCYFTVQLEFAQRLTAKPNTKDYGSLSCFVQYYSEPKILFKIPPQAFKPAPKVVSCLIELKFHKPRLLAKNENFLFRLIQAGFSQRRKKIANALNSYAINEEIFRQCSLTGQERAENLSLRNFIDLANLLT